MKNIYIILTQSGTGVSKTLKFITKDTYNHASIALDSTLQEFYSFGRKKVNNPLNGGFIIETPFTAVFAKYSNTPCMVLELPLSNEQYNDMEELINTFIKNKENFKYAFLGLFLTDTFLNLSNPNKFFCSQFVAHVLNKVGIKTAKKPIHIHPIDFLKLNNVKIIYEGILQKYSSKKDLKEFITVNS